MPTADSDTPQTCIDPILDEIDRSSRQLLDALLDERASLRTRDVVGLHSAARRKCDLIESLEHAEGRRASLVAAAGGMCTVEGFDRYLRGLDPTGRLSLRWGLITERIRRCRHENLLNGAMLESSRRFIEQMLGILRGTTTPPQTYGPRGQITPPLPPRRIAEV